MDPFYRRGNGGSESLSSLPKVTQLVSGGVGFKFSTIMMLYYLLKGTGIDFEVGGEKLQNNLLPNQYITLSAEVSWEWKPPWILRQRTVQGTSLGIKFSFRANCFFWGVGGLCYIFFSFIPSQGVFIFAQLNRNPEYLKESRRKQALSRELTNPSIQTKGKGAG